MKTCKLKYIYSRTRTSVQFVKNAVFKSIAFIYLILSAFACFGQVDSMYVYDDLGERLSLEEITVPLGGGGCSSGIFNLVFTDAAGNGFNDPLNIDFRNTVCQVFSDLSVLINPANNPYTGASNVGNQFVNIEVVTSNGLPNNQPARGNSNYRFFPGTYSGVLDGEVWKTINGGVDSYREFISFTSVANGTNVGLAPPQLFHGILRFNFASPYAPYNNNFTAPCPSGQIDVYSLILQEAFHCLGFNSLMRFNGTSVYTPRSFYSRFDTFLQEGGLPLVNNWFPCNQIAYSGQPLTNTCASTVFNSAQTINAPIFSPTPFMLNGSLCYLDETCGSPYMMDAWTRNTQSGVTKRHPEAVDYSILCDLGYSLNNEFGTLSSGSDIYFQYAGTCGYRLAGVDDMINFNTCNQYSVVSGGTILLDGLTEFNLNDEEQNANPQTIACVEMVSVAGTGTITAWNPFPATISYSAPANFTGYAVIKYIPIGQNGELGNFTYIYIRVDPISSCTAGCTQNLVNNGSFENVFDNFLFPLDNLISQPATGTSNNTPDGIFHNGTNWVRWQNLPFPGGFTTGLYSGCEGQSLPLPDSWNGFAVNIRYAHLACYPTNTETIQLELCNPLVEDHEYQLSFYAKIHQNIGSTCSTDVTFATSPLAAPLPPQNTFIGGANTYCGNTYNIDVQTVVNVDADHWQLYTVNFIYNSSNVDDDGNFLFVRGGNNSVNLLIDDISITCVNSIINEQVVPPCSTLCNGIIDITPIGCLAPYTYSWNNGSTSEDQSNLCPNTYTVTVTDAMGCTFSETYILNSVATCEYFTLTKIANPPQTYAGSPVDFEITICNNTGWPQTVNVLDDLPLPADFVVYSTSFNPFDILTPVNLLASPACTTFHIYGYFTTVGPCTDPGHINVVTLDHPQTSTSLSANACVEVYRGCPFMISGTGGCEEDDIVQINITGHVPVPDVMYMNFSIIYPNFLGLPDLNFVDEFGQYHNDVVPGSSMAFAGAYNATHDQVDVTVVFDQETDLTPPQNWILQFPFFIEDPVPFGTNVFPVYVTSINGFNRIQVLDDASIPVISGGAWTQANYITLQYCDGITPLDASFTLSQIPCDIHGGVTVTANNTTPGLIHNWTWGDNRTTAINGATTFTYNYYDEICAFTGYNVCNPPGNPNIIPPANPGIYTITHTVIDLVTGVSAIETQQVVLSPSCCTAQTKIGNNSTVTSLGVNSISGTVEIEGLFTINQPFNFNNATVIMEPGSEIVVEPGNNLDINHSDFSACSNMWKGITVQQDAAIRLTGSTIADAQYAVNMLDGSIGTIVNNTFERNFVGIHAPQSPTYFNAISLFVAENTFKSGTGLVGQFTGQNPLPSTKSFAGIELYDMVLDLKNPGYNPNIFEDMSNGIIGNRLELDASNCLFTDILPLVDYDGLTPFNGSGITCTGGNGAFSLNQTGFGKNSAVSTFNNCHYGITCSRMSVYSNDNKMTLMKMGYRIEYCSYSTIEILDNYIESERNGIDLRFNDNTKHLHVEHNEIHFGHPSIVGSKGHSAIHVIEQNGDNSDSRIYGNEIFHNPMSTNASHGIYLSTAANYKVTENRIHMYDNSYNNNGIYSIGSMNPEISCNTIVGSYSNYTNKYQSAIFIFINRRPVVSCNNVDGTYNGIYFSGPSSGTVVKGNNINSHVVGIHLDNSALIDVQDYRGNLWYQPAINSGFNALYENVTNALIYTWRVDPTVVIAGSNPVPSTVFPNAGWINSSTGNNFLCEDHGINYCSQFMASGGGGSYLDYQIANDNLQNDPFTAETKWMLKSDLFKKLTEDPSLMLNNALLTSFYNATQNQLIGQFDAIKEINEGLFDLDQSVISSLNQNKLLLEQNLELLKSYLEQLSNSNLTTSQLISLKASIDAVQQNITTLLDYNKTALGLVAETRILSAENVKSVNNNIMTSELIQENEKLINNVYLETIAKEIYSFSESQSETILSIAQQCPITGGRSVAAARALYAMIDDNMTYDDITQCLNEGIVLRNSNSSNENSGTSNNLLNTEFTVNMIPNPAKESTVLHYELGNRDNGEFEIYDAYGHLILKKQLNGNNNVEVIDLSKISSGMYQYKVMTSDNKSIHGKLSIVK